MGLAIGGFLSAVGFAVLLQVGFPRESKPRNTPSPDRESPRAATVHHHPVPQADELLGWRIYDQLRRQRSNFVFSPHSIATALRMLGAGASGQTATELEGLLLSTPQEP